MISSLSSLSSLRVHTSIVSAAAILAIGEKQISVKWNETSKQAKKEVSILLPMECLSAPEVPDSFRALVEAALISSAKDVLKSFVESNPNCFDVSGELFDRDVLVGNFLASGSNWLKREELELAFTSSATWRRIVSRPEFSTNKTYQAVATRFKETILKLSGKATQIPPDDCDKILCKLEDSDLSTPFGEFIVSRLEQMKSKKPEVLDLSSL